MKKLLYIPIVIAIIFAIPISGAFAADSDFPAGADNGETEIRIGYEVYEPGVKAEDSIYEPGYEIAKWENAKNEKIPDDEWIGSHAPSSAEELKGYELCDWRVTSYPDDSIINILYYYYKPGLDSSNDAIEHIKLNAGTEVIADDYIESLLGEAGEENEVADAEDAAKNENADNGSASEGGSSNTAEEEQANEGGDSEDNAGQDHLLYFVLAAALAVVIVAVLFISRKKS